MVENYPASPAHVDESLTRPTPEFRREIFKVLLSILLFISVYIILMVAAVALAIGAGYGGLMLMSFHINFMTLMLGLGLIGLGLMVLFFLVKFIFKTSQTDRSHLVEIKRKDQPELFAFIKQLTKEVKAPFPKRIYLSTDVNASVFYDSGFWSMFFPVRKNLQIGLGLVNSMNLSEFKAVLAHEFGHFSQRSMKLGSYVYNVNRVIYNMLYDNDGYQNTLDKWANISNYFALFAGFTIGIVKGIQAILKEVHSVVNKNYYSLSRQMEFHADTVAASVAGGNHLVSALRRLELADACQRELLNYCGNMVEDNQRLSNLFLPHRVVMKQTALELKIELRDELPIIDKETVHRLATSRVVVKDQWASHPSTDDREEHLTRLNLTTETMNKPAWLAFNNPEKLQQELTDMIYSAVTFKAEPTQLTVEEFTERYQKDLKKNEFHSIYQGFYDTRDVLSFEEIPISTSTLTTSEILTQELMQVPKQINVLSNDIGILEAIQQPRTEIKSFDFDGKRYVVAEAATITEMLKNELAALENQVNESETSLVALAFRNAIAQNLAQDLRERYKTYHISNDNFKTCADQYYKIMDVVQPAYQGQLTVDQALLIDNDIKLEEQKIKGHMKAFLENPRFEEWCLPKDSETLRTYLKGKRDYFSVENGFDNEALALFSNAHVIFYNAVHARMLQAKKNLLDWQAQFLQ